MVYAEENNGTYTSFTKSEESGVGNTAEKLCFIIRKKNEKIRNVNFQLTDKNDTIG